MEYLFYAWDSLKQDLKGKHIFLFLDYDGTLTPIADSSDKALISPKAKRLLSELSGNPYFKLAIISGRALADIKNKLKLENIIYAGNHGLELESPKIKFSSSLSQEYKDILASIKRDLSQRLSSVKGVVIEDKGLSLSLHYRLADKKNIPEVKAAFQESVGLYLKQKKIKIGGGKMLLEARPPQEWDKGKVVLWLLARQRFALKDKDVLPVYIGDDMTDEDAFRVLRDKGITVFVGKPRVSLARYYLNDSKEVLRFLSQLLESKNQ